MKGWVGLVGWPVADGLFTQVVTHQLQVEHRTGKACRPKTNVLPLFHANQPNDDENIPWEQRRSGTETEWRWWPCNRAACAGDEEWSWSECRTLRSPRCIPSVVQRPYQPRPTDLRIPSTSHPVPVDDGGHQIRVRATYFSNLKTFSIIRYDTIRWTVLTCAQKLTSSQLSLPHGTKQKRIMKKPKQT